MKNTINTYTHLKNKLELESIKNSNDKLAYFTHFLQCSKNGVSQYFRKDAENFLAERLDQIKSKNIVDIKTFIPKKWDVPFPPVENPDFTFIDLFAGIGGFRIAFQKKNGKCVFSSEWDKYAQKTYEANFGEVPFGDITKIHETNIPNHDILLGGFPCQPFSLAGVSKKNSLGRSHGFADETQGTLFYDIIRILKEKRPKAFLLENVKNLKSHDKGRTYKIIIEALRELNYTVYDKIIDARHYVPQHRERIFLAGFNNDLFKNANPFIFPTPSGKQYSIRKILESNPDKKYTLSDNLWRYLQGYAKKHKEKGNGFGYGMAKPDDVTRTLSARYYKDGSEILIAQGKGRNPRKLTPEECKILMGYPEKYKIRNIGVSDTQLYRQFGNSVVVPVISAIADEMISYMKSCHAASKKNLRKKKVIAA